MNWPLVIVIIIVIGLIWWLIARSQPSSENLPTADVDINRYLGTWYEIARLPTPYQQNCQNSVATYSLNENGTINVVNRCEIEGRVIEARGIAYPVGKGRLAVQFENSPVKGDYNILYVDPNYQIALVGTNDRQSLWILSRSRSINPTIYQQLVTKANQLGYDTLSLIRQVEIGTAL